MFDSSWRFIIVSNFVFVIAFTNHENYLKNKIIYMTINRVIFMKAESI